MEPIKILTTDDIFQMTPPPVVGTEFRTPDGHVWIVYIERATRKMAYRRITKSVSGGQIERKAGF